MDFEVLRKFVTNQERSLRDILHYFEKFKMRQQDHEKTASKLKSDLQRLKQSKQKSRKLISGLLTTHQISTLKSQTIQSLNKKLLPAITELRDQLTTIKQTLQAQQPKARKQSTEQAQLAAAKMKQEFRKYLTKHNNVKRLVFGFHAKGCVSEASQAIEGITNLMQKVNPEKN